jgi:outer membrane biosynthesis protein TonB
MIYEGAAMNATHRVGRVSRRLTLAAVSVLAIASLSACTAAKAATPLERPALIVPPPPPRAITPPPLPEVQPAPEVVGETPATTNKPAPRPRPQNQRDTTKPEPPKVDPLPETAPPPAAPPPPVTPQLRMPEGGDTAATARQARDTIERTRRIVSNIDPARLSSVLQKALTDAKAFTTQAEEALNAGNVVFAKELAEKAERLAKELQGRLAH